MLKVYLDPCTINCRKVLAGLDLLGTQHEVIFIDYFAGKQKSPEFVKINPNATIPAAVDGDLCLTESNAILMYAADASDSAYPQDVKKRAKINTWLLFEASAWFETCYVWLVEYVVKPLLKAEPDQAVIDAKTARFHQLASTLDAQLAQTRYITGDDVTIADIAIAAPMHLHTAQKLPLDQHPNLKRWIADIEKLPSWMRTQGAVDKALLPNRPVGSSSSAVRANFNYTKESEKPTELYFYENPAAAQAHEPGDDPHEMAVTDGWPIVDNFSIDKQGFSVEDFKTDFDRWEDESTVHSRFYPQVVDFLKQTLGAARVLVFDHTIRTKANVAKKLTDQNNTSQRAPVSLVHCDYTAESGPTRVRQLLKDEADDLLSRRVAFINVWKPIRTTVLESPLAMCDIDSSPPADFFKLHLRYQDRDGENYVMRHSDSHKWWYFPKMTPEQVILLKTYESETDGRARFVGHSAFEDPTSPADAPRRESVEIRTICFF